MKQVVLSDWELAGYWPHVPLMQLSMENGLPLAGVTDWIQARVPGSVHDDLLRAGLIEDPYFGCNSLACEWVSNRWWVYRCRFHMGPVRQEDRWELVLEGIDYRAHIQLNGRLLGVHTGMFRPAVMDVAQCLREGGNELLVILEHAPDEMSQIGYTSATHTQKGRFGYKWDFGTRLVHLGLYGVVSLRTRGRYPLADLRIDAVPVGGNRLQAAEGVGSAATVQDVRGAVAASATSPGRVTMVWQVPAEREDQVDVHARLTLDGGRQVEAGWQCGLQPGMNRFEWTLAADAVRLWQPNGHGAQPLYPLEVTCTDADGHVEACAFQIGFRTLAYRRNEGASSDALPYTAVINGKPIYLKGVNLVPLDHMYGAVSDARYEDMVRLMAQAHVNLVRVWGGGLVESRRFYELCDACGILVWQEFIQSSSGIDNVPSVDAAYLALLAQTAEAVVRSRRNHVCLAFWSGGNELMQADRIPVRQDHPNIALLASIVADGDPGRLFLPSSASGPLEFLDPDRPGENHDVHGPWKYGGTESHYTLYNRSDSQLHSEFGVDGMACAASLASFLAPEDLRVTDMMRNRVWRHHGEWWDTLSRDEGIFGPFPDLETFSRCSQLVQAEGIRYAVESNRRRMFANSGSIVWQFNEPWPNVSCTSLVEWSGRPKAAYHALRCAYRPRMLSLRYGKWAWDGDERFEGRVFAHNEHEAFQGHITCEIRSAEGDLLLQRREAHWISENMSRELFDIAAPVPAGSRGFRVWLSLRDDEGHAWTSRYDFPIRDALGFCDTAFFPLDPPDAPGT